MTITEFDERKLSLSTYYFSHHILVRDWVGVEKAAWLEAREGWVPVLTRSGSRSWVSMVVGWWGTWCG